MKNTVKLFGIIALVAVIGFSMVACDEDDGGGDPTYVSFPESLVGVWENSETEISFGNNNLGIGSVNFGNTASIMTVYGLESKNGDSYTVKGDNQNQTFTATVSGGTLTVSGLTDGGNPGSVVDFTGCNGTYTKKN